MLRKRKNITEGQSIMEFAFCMAVVLIMLYGTAMIFRWTGMDLAERRIAYEQSMAISIEEDYGSCGVYNCFHPVNCRAPSCLGIGAETCDCLRNTTKEEGPLKQLGGSFYNPVRMNAVWGDEYK